eukprot:scaffold7549_cov110-Skeletonema_dohrnii-CCMP3373.AAC.5
MKQQQAAALREAARRGTSYQPVQITKGIGMSKESVMKRGAANENQVVTKHSTNSTCRSRQATFSSQASMQKETMTEEL